MAITLFNEDPPPSSHDEPAHLAAPHDLAERVHRLEEEVGELRSLVTRFADVVIEEVKDLHANKVSLPLPDESAHSLPMVAQGIVSPKGAVATPVTPQRRRWLVIELFRDLRTTLQMYFDPQYRVRRSTQLLVPIIVAAFICNIVFFTWVFTLPIVSTILEKTVDVFLSVLMYKVLQHEMERYREAVVQHAAWRSYQASRSDLIMMTTDPEHPPTTREGTE